MQLFLQTDNVVLGMTFLMKLYGPFEPGRLWQFLMGNDRTTYFPVLFSDLLFRAILTWHGCITNEMVLADRNVVTVAGREEGETVHLGNCQNECWNSFGVEGMRG